MNSNNAAQFLSEAFQQNPQLRQIMKFIQNGGNGKALYEMLAEQRGADPNLILNKLMN